MDERRLYHQMAQVIENFLVYAEANEEDDDMLYYLHDRMQNAYKVLGEYYGKSAADIRLARAGQALPRKPAD